eukprot:c17910_g1_i1 orf=302-721(-)
MTSFFLPFSGQELWTEETVLQFVQGMAQQHLQSWLQGMSIPDFLAPQFPSCIGAIQWLEREECFCMPMLLFVDESDDIPLAIRDWYLKSMPKKLGCTRGYLSQWLEEASHFSSGCRVGCLPQDVVTYSRSRKEPKRPRS